MRLRNRLATWLGHPIRLGVAVLAFGIDIATVVDWAQDDDGLLMNIRLGPPAYSLVLFVCTTFGVIALWGWYVTFPHRPRNKFKALYREIDIARAALQAYMLTRFDHGRTLLEADRTYSRLAVKLRSFGITLPSHDITDLVERAARWNLLVDLAAYASVGDIKTARARTGDG